MVVYRKRRWRSFYYLNDVYVNPPFISKMYVLVECLYLQAFTYSYKQISLIPPIVSNQIAHKPCNLFQTLGNLVRGVGEMALVRCEWKLMNHKVEKQATNISSKPQFRHNMCIFTVHLPTTIVALYSDPCQLPRCPHQCKIIGLAQPNNYSVGQREIKDNSTLF